MLSLGVKHTYWKSIRFRFGTERIFKSWNFENTKMLSNVLYLVSILLRATVMIFLETFCSFECVLENKRSSLARWQSKNFCLLCFFPMKFFGNVFIPYDRNTSLMGNEQRSSLRNNIRSLDKCDNSYQDYFIQVS